MKTSLILAYLGATLAMTLTGCGGGGSSTAPDNSQPIKDALPAIGEQHPAPPAFKGAFMEVNGVAIGLVLGKDKYDVVTIVANKIINQPNATATLGAGPALVGYQAAYKAMLSDAGLKVVLFGEQIAVGGASGLPIYAPDVVATVTLRNDGLHVVF